ncbi:hypothetical protein BYT27DRAFT_7170423 [Phlegmacium glaucopus]|nr:hypothetical protein BYT27DRAFT_7170423 [Phlegmacium glaucopus]
MHSILRAQLVYESDATTACKYLAVVGLVFLVYDHILSFADEVELIWKARWTFPKAIFLILRYSVPCALIVHNYQLAALSTVDEPGNSCQVWFNIVVCLGMATTAIGNFLVLLRLWVIRNRNRIFICSTLVLFLVAHVASIACVVVVLINVTPSLVFDPQMSTCVIERRSVLGSLYAPAVIFDGIALAATFWNALGRSRNQEELSLLQYLRQDGFYFVLLLFRKCFLLFLTIPHPVELIPTMPCHLSHKVMRVINFFATLFGPLHSVFLTIYLIWATTTVTVSWLVLDLRRNGRSAKDTELESVQKSSL